MWTTLSAALGIIFLPPTSSLRDNVAAVLILLTLSICGAIILRVKKKSASVKKIGEEIDEEFEESAEAEFSSLDPNTMQKLTRTRIASGEEQISAILRADFAAQQLSTTLHLPFCPPFSVPPRVSIFPLAENEKLNCSVPRTLSAGVRIDLKRTQTAAAQYWIEVIVNGTTVNGKTSNDK